VGRDSGRACPDRRGQWSVGLYNCRKAVFGRHNSAWDNSITGGGCEPELVARTGTWHHLAATFTPTGTFGKEIRIYRDGIMQWAIYGNAICRGGADVKDTGDLFLGLDYTGRLDDVIIFDKMLTHNEVTTLSQMPTCCQ